MTKRTFVKFFSLCLMLTILASLGSPQIFSHALSLGQASVIATKCNLYTSPDFTSEKVTVLDEEEQTVLITLRFNDSVTINEIQEDFALVTTSKNVNGWVYRFYLTQNQSQDIYPVFNGTISKDTTIYDLDKQTPIATATKGTRVYLYEGFDKESDFTAVQIVLSDTSLCVGYIATPDVEPDGVSKMLIVAITVIVAAVTIVLSLVFIKKKKKKGKKLKSGT